MQDFKVYQAKLCQQINALDLFNIEKLAQALINCSSANNQLYICGNGGSAGNAVHLANDFLYGVDPTAKRSLNVEALSANISVVTCLGNDIGFDKVFSHQLKVKGRPNDVLLVLSGSGNSINIVNALQEAKTRSITSFAIVGYNGGEAKRLADHVIHSDVNDMQIAEDLQLVIGHMLMQRLNAEFTK